MSHNFVQFEDTAKTVADRLTAMGPNGYAILDTYPGTFSPTDPRTQIASLAYYYLLGDPKKTYVMFNGGYEPSSTWQRHWTDAVKYNVGKPTSAFTTFASGRDPANRSLTFKVYQRQYQNALVLYKPVSYAKGVNGTTGDQTATSWPRRHFGAVEKRRRGDSRQSLIRSTGNFDFFPFLAGPAKQ